MATRYGHTNLIARDWRRLARFYEDVFGCAPVQPERDLSGEWLERGSGVNGARVRGIHLRLPGCGAVGPTLEIFQYAENAEAPPPPANRVGFCHIAFVVDNVDDMRRRVLDAGGTPVGAVVTVKIADVGNVTWTYVRDPEGNIIELQRKQ